jgi:ATP-dependent helicase/nuclease subunit B
MSELTAFSTVITANLRQAFYLRETLSFASNTRIISLSQYLLSKIDSGLSNISNTNGTLTDFEDREVWESVIKQWQRSQDKHLVNTSATARLAKEAFDLLIQYELPDFDTDEFATSETSAMKAWLMDYQKALVSKGVVTSVIKDAYIFDEIMTGSIPLPNNMAFYGFYSPTLKESKLLSWAQTQNIPHYLHDKNEINVSCRSFSEISDEVSTCAAWVKAKLEENENATVGIIVPDLLKHKSLLQQVFDHTLVPSSIYQPINNHERPYRISMGSPLISYAPIKAFFDIFKIRLNSKFFFDDISAFLRNPLIGGSQHEYVSRAKLEVQIRKLGAKKVSWDTIKRIANTETHNGLETNYYCPDLVERMEAHEAWLSQYGKGRYHYHDMANIFRETASMWGLLDLAEEASYSEVILAFFGDEKGNGALQLFAKLGNTLPPVSMIKAINKLRSIATETKFQPSSGSTQVQILSESHALGIKFDAVWMLGLTSNNWPQKAKVNPFILQEIQVDKAVPHASAEQELDYARLCTQQILSSARESVLSSHVSENGEEIRPSSIMIDYGQMGDAEKNDLPRTKLAIALSTATKRITIVDNNAPPLDMSNQIHGGTGLFKSQALCPFKGFVENRLGIAALEEPQVGLSASLRGDVLHVIFEHFWRKVKDQATLKSLELSGELDTAVAASVKSALAVFQKSKADIFTPRLVDIETKRLRPLTAKWMRSIELKRPEFSDVQVETAHNIIVKGMQMKVKMDHVDIDVATNTINLADNKTGQVNTSDWFSPRLLEPQLPLYAMIEVETGNALNSIVFKKVKNGDMSVKGVSATDNAFPKFKPAKPVEGLVPMWKEQIYFLADEYQAGVANISPATVAKACTYCPHKSSCRFHLT